MYLTYDCPRIMMMVLACEFCVSCQRESASPPEAPTPPPNQKQEVIGLLRQWLLDSKAWDKRVRMQSDKLGPLQVVGTKYWYEKYPVMYGREKLIARGRAVVPVLRDIAQDQDYADIHFVAWQSLAVLDCPDCLKELYQAGKEKRLSPAKVAGVIQTCLPVHISAKVLRNDKVIDWLGSQLTEKTFDEFVLSLLDVLLTAEYKDGGMYPGLLDSRMLRWLNRVYDIDLDVWLAEKAPAVRKFRDEQLSKGYDPAGFDLGNNMSFGLLDEAMKAIYPRPEEQSACRELLGAVYPGLLPGGKRSSVHPRPARGWEERLKKWYWGNRKWLRYDPTLLRFVSDERHAMTRPET